MADEGQDSLREMTSATPPDEGEEERRLQDPRSGEERDPLERSTVEDKRMANEVRQETQLEANEGLVDEDPDAAAAETLDNPDTKSALDVVVDKKSDNEEGEHPERHELEKNESGGELQSNRSESLSDGSSSASSDVAAVAAASSRSEREGLELDLQQNDKENGWYCCLSFVCPSVPSAIPELKMFWTTDSPESWALNGKQKIQSTLIVF